MTIRSYVSSSVSKLGEKLRGTTNEQVSDYKERFSVVKEMYDEFMKDLIVQRFNSEKCFEFAVNFFGKPRIKFVAIDGTAYAREIFDLVIFFGGAYACEGEIEFSKKGRPKIKYSTKVIEEGQGISSCVPLYINEIPEIDQTFFEEKEGELALGKSLQDEEIINNSQIALSIMHFAEYFLAYMMVKNDPEVGLILLDRTLSGDQASFISKTSKKENWERKSALINFNFEGRKITSRLLEYGRYRIYNPELDLPPPRGDYLKYRLIYLIEEKGPINLETIIKELKTEERIERVEKILKKLEDDGFIKETKGYYDVVDELKDAWSILKKLVEFIGKRVFEENELQIEKYGKNYWLTTLDLSFLTLFCIYMLIEECWKRNILLVGMTKDTSAKDFKSHFIPICQNSQIISLNIDQRKLALIPNTDRMFLQSLSLLNLEQISPPWSLIEYDSSFKTLVPARDEKTGVVLPGYVRGAIRNKISPERLFLKSYIQLIQAKSDKRLRSNVLAIDRLVFPLDLKSETIVTFKNKYGKFEELVKVIVYKDKNVENKIQNMLLEILYYMSETNIPELFGHNKPLFVADKIAKWHVNVIKNVIKAMKRWIMNNPELRDFVFYMSTFRERRGKIERYRGG
ncbi:MAG: hypothetical protein J7L07_05750 [Candidatus Odinarchaeota archaeon]|nr:hypothetical protein [Candidatus Odinarchaeota archaeon]